MTSWRGRLRVDPVPALLRAKEPAVQFFARRDLLDESPGRVEDLWRSAEVTRLVARQLPSGGWKYPSPRLRLRSAENYDQIETFRVLSDLVERYGAHKGHPAVRRARRYVLAHQSAAGDIRGIYGTQYSPNYTAAFLELLTKAGFGAERRVERAYQWLLSIRQHDGGWAIPLRTARQNFDARTLRAGTIEPVPNRPSSHLVTGCVLRAFAAHPRYRQSVAAREAGSVVAARLFKPDLYADRRAAAFWTHFSFPFWFTDLVSALDSLSLIGFPASDSGIARGVDWLIRHQHPTGEWRLYLTRGSKTPDHHAWHTLAICRVFRRLFE